MELISASITSSMVTIPAVPPYSSITTRSCRRSLRVRSMSRTASSPVLEPVASRASDSHERITGPSRGQLAAQPVDVRLDQVASAVEIVVPDVLDDLVTSQKAPLVEHEVLQDRVLIWGHRHGLAAHRERASRHEQGRRACIQRVSP